MAEKPNSLIVNPLPWFFWELGAIFISNGKTMDYKKHYHLLVRKALERVSCTEYTELHHILPKCLGGPDDAANTVRLTAREHFVAHWLLHRAYPDHDGLAFAFRQMANMRNRGLRKYVPSSRAIAESREAFANAMRRIKGHEVHCYNAEGQYVGSFESHIKAAKETGGKQASIWRCVSGLQSHANGYQFRAEYTESLPAIETPSHPKEVEVTLLDTGDFIGKFTSVNGAARALGISSSGVSRVLNGLLKSTKGYIIKHATN